MSSKNSSRQGTPPQSSKSGTQMVRMSDSGCSPIGSQSPLEKQHFSGRPSKGGGQQLHSGRHDFQDDMPQPRKKTQIIYDLGSPETCTQGMNACIPVTTDKYTYTITSVLTRSGSSTSPPLSPTSSLGGGPISSSRCTNKHVTARMGRSSPAWEVYPMKLGNIPLFESIPLEFFSPHLLDSLFAFLDIPKYFFFIEDWPLYALLIRCLLFTSVCALSEVFICILESDWLIVWSRRRFSSSECKIDLLLNGSYYKLISTDQLIIRWSVDQFDWMLYHPMINLCQLRIFRISLHFFYATLNSGQTRQA